MPQAKTLKIFLLDGEATGTKIVEIGNWTGKAFVIPRNKLKNILQRDELGSQAVYFLIGESEDGGHSVYVGEAEDFKQRIQQHNQKKDFWNLAICFISKDENLTKAHVKYLEAMIIEGIQKIDRIKLENGNNGGVPKLPEADEADMNVYLDNLKIVLSSLGLTFLEDLAIQDEDNEEIYYVKGRSVSGKIKFTNEGYVVQKGSVLTGEDVPSFAEQSLSKVRKSYLESDRTRRLDDGNFELLENVIFSSPSYAAAFLLGRHTNGWTKLKNKEGKTLDELKRK